MVRAVPVLHVLSALIVLFALSMLLPCGVSFLYGDAAWPAYYRAVPITLGSGAVLWAVTRPGRGELQPRDSLLLVALVWTVLPAFATLPLILYLPELSFTDAYF
jgi:trk/ktr system potassium uptake protein